VGDVYDEQRRITSTALSCMSKKSKWDTCFEQWKDNESQDIKKLQSLMQDLKTSDTRSLSMFFLALNQIQAMSSKV